MSDILVGEIMDKLSLEDAKSYFETLQAKQQEKIDKREAVVVLM
jgi:hypothetical protein